VVSFTSDTNLFKNKSSGVVKDFEQFSCDKYLILNDDDTNSLFEVENKKKKRELPIDFETVNNHLYNITIINREKKFPF